MNIASAERLPAKAFTWPLARSARAWGTVGVRTNVAFFRVALRYTSGELPWATEINTPGASTSATDWKGEASGTRRSEEHTSELQSRLHLVCRLLLEKKKKKTSVQESKDRCNRRK